MYWQEPDNGMWEERMEVHASSLGACVAGLRSIQTFVDVPEDLIRNGEIALNALLPRESLTKDTDLALLSLIYPFKIISRKMALQILEDVTGKLERTYGCIRYEGDQYFYDKEEAQWCFGFPWLGLCYQVLHDLEKTAEYWRKTKGIVPLNGEVPELYVGGLRPNHHAPLAWAVALVLLFYDNIFNETNYGKIERGE